jgi:cupin 2 domain-containing protein
MRCCRGLVYASNGSSRRFWYDQTDGEWVLVLAGAARLRFEDETDARLLGPGD